MVGFWNELSFEPGTVSLTPKLSLHHCYILTIRQSRGLEENDKILGSMSLSTTETMYRHSSRTHGHLTRRPARKAVPGHRSAVSSRRTKTLEVLITTSSRSRRVVQANSLESGKKSDDWNQNGMLQRSRSKSHDMSYGKDLEGNAADVDMRGEKIVSSSLI